MRQKGFSLVEILVTISIIGLLASVGLATYKGIQSKANDTARKSDLTQLSLSLEAYKLSHNYKYIDGTLGAEGTCSSADTAKFYTDIASYMSNRKVPKDPKTNIEYCYVSINNGASYRLFAKLENCTETGPNYYCGNTYNYTIFSNNIGSAAAP